MPPKPVIVVKNGKRYVNCNIALVVNHAYDYIKGVPEYIVIMGVYSEVNFIGTRTTSLKALGKVSLADFWSAGGYSYYEAGLWWLESMNIEAIQVFYVSSAQLDSKDMIQITSRLPIEFVSAAYDPDYGVGLYYPNGSKFPKYSAAIPFNGRGRWHLSHVFPVEISGNNIIYLWRYSAPAIFEAHSHVMSNHCATLPAIWEKDSFIAMIEPGYSFQDFLGPWVKGEMVTIGREETKTIAATYLSHLSGSNFQAIFPFLRTGFKRLGSALPMDMEFMHFLGYDGVPIIRVHEGTRWYCWNKKWGRSTNNQDTYTTPMFPGSMPMKIPKQYQTMPNSVDRETWRYMSPSDAELYSPWVDQIEHHRPLLKNSTSNVTSRIMPMYHFDPRRYSGKGTGNEPVSKVLDSVVHSTSWNKKDQFVGIKLYTAMGWAPMDPLLKKPLADFYTACANSQIPLINHCSPAGFYTHDRKFYFDLLKERGLVSALPKIDADGWPTSFLNWAYTPQNTVWTSGGKKLEPKTVNEKIWWFIQQYVAPLSWKGVIDKHKDLKLCFAHFASSEHLEVDSWSKRKGREPESAKKDLTVAFEGSKIVASKTHGFIYDLLTMIKPDNRVFVDLSYVILNEDNTEQFADVFAWARVHKPILLERILWGTDWPLIGCESMVKDASTEGQKNPPLLYKYAKGFTENATRLPNDFFLRCCFLNQAQFWGIDVLKKKVPNSFAWTWVDELPKSIFSDYTSDKTLLLYKDNPKLFHRMAG